VTKSAGWSQSVTTWKRIVFGKGHSPGLARSGHRSPTSGVPRGHGAARYIHVVTAASGGWETWSWDESLFSGAAGYYERGRLPYAPGLADAFASSLALDGRGRLLDVGCGPGTVTLRLASLFEAAVGLDPDPEMLACASRAAADRGVGNVAWVRQRAEALPAGLGSFRAVTFAASFHWMDRPLVASAVATMLDRDGAVVQVDAPGYRAHGLAAEARQGSLPFPPPPDDALDQLRRQYLGSDMRAGQGIRNASPDGEDQVFREAGFRPAQTVTVPDQRIIERTTDDVVARVFSSSSTAPHLFGDRLEDFETDMREILAHASPSGRFSLRLPDNILRIWRLPGLSGGSAGLARQRVNWAICRITRTKSRERPSVSDRFPPAWPQRPNQRQGIRGASGCCALPEETSCINLPTRRFGQ
jgi:SAM-dependent methyltransferase